MELSEAKELLNGCIREELQDHAFGDAEMFWFKEDHETQVAGGYFGGRDSRVWFCLNEILVGEHKLMEAVGADPSSITFEGVEARELRECGRIDRIDRNDETGPDEFVEGYITPGLTKEAVLREITSPPKGTQ